MSKLHVAVVSDVHGNRWALEAVLEDIQRRHVEEIVNLGDSVYGPLDPVGTAQLLIQNNIQCIKGNQDGIICSPSSGKEEPQSLRIIRQSLSAETFKWLESLPRTAILHDNIFICHGTPAQYDEYLLEAVTEHGVFLKRSEELMSMLLSIKQSVVLCGHSHLQRVVSLPNGKLIVNPGSVGLPAYTDQKPLPHGIESGSPHARYCIVAKDEVGWSIDNVAIPYDWESASAVAAAKDRPDWARWIRAGRV